MKREGDPIIWLEYAESDLELAKVGKITKNIKYSSLCFHSQQSAEKSIKGVLVFYKINFPKTHDIRRLLRLLKEKEKEIPKIVDESHYLSQYAVTARYPGDELTIDRKEYKETIDTATLVFKWAKSIINKKSNKLF